VKTEHGITRASAIPGWRKSSYSGGGNANCLEVVDGFATGVPVRDSKNAHGPALVFEPAAWSSFVAAVRTGELLA
jgi:hypothetical protein